MTDRVYIHHLRREKICVSGARGFWKTRGWDFRDFLDNGISAEVLEATGDAHALKIVAKLRGETNGKK